MIIAQLSDPHIRPRGVLAFREVDTNQMLAEAIDRLNQFRPGPDVVVFTGDLTHQGQAAEYEMLREILGGLAHPVYLLPGNHDNRALLRAAFPEHTYWPKAKDSPFLHYVVDGFAVRIIALDSVVAGEVRGELCEARLAWLEARLAEAPDQPTIIFMHHPPFPTGIKGMDRVNCGNGEAMAAVVRRHPQVERVACGHHHRAAQIRWAGTIGSIAPSTAHQVHLDLGPRKARYCLESPGIQLHVWLEGAGVVTHTCAVGDFGGPRPFVAD